VLLQSQTHNDSSYGAILHSELTLVHDITLYTKIHFLCPDIRSWELGTEDIRIISNQNTLLW